MVHARISEGDKTSVGDSVARVEDVVAFLVEQHEAIQEVMPRVLRSVGVQRESLFAAVRQALAVHEAFEQVVVHPHARFTAGDTVVTNLMAEERKAENSIAALEILGVDTEEFGSGYAALIHDVTAHAEHEEKDEFPRISHQFTRQERAQIQRGVELTRSAADTSTDSLTFAEMLTNAKTAIAGHE